MKKIVALLNTLLLCLMASAALAQTASTIGNLQPGGLVQPSDYLPVARSGCTTEGDCKVQVGTAAAQNVGTSGATLGLLNTVNTYSALQLLSGDLTAADAVFTGGAITLPSGASGTRPGSPVNGMLRYNSVTPGFEGYVNGTWGPISGGGSAAGSTGNLQINAGSGAFGAYSGLTCASHKWMNALDASGSLSTDCVQPQFSDLGGTASNSQIPAPTTSSLGGLLALAAATTHDVVQYIDTTGMQHLVQLGFSDLAGALSYGQMPNSGATAGSYTNVSATVNAEGIITAISTGSGGSMVYPGAGIANSTGSAWGTSYTTTGTGSVLVAAASPTITGTLNGPASIWSGVEKVNLNAASLPAAQTGTVLQIGNADTTATRMEADAFGASAYFSGVRKDGTNASPTTLQSGDEIASLNAWGYNGSAIVGPQAALREFAAQNWAGSAYGTYLSFATTPNGSSTLTEAIRIENDGGITVPSTVSGGDKGAGTINLSGGAYAANFIASGTGADTLPAGTVGQRPGSPGNGMIRYNSSTPAVEAYVNGAWTALATSSGVSVTAATPDLVITPSPGTGTFTIGATNIINAQSGTSYTVLSTDMGKTVTNSNAAATAVTLPQAGTTGFLAGASYTEINLGAGAVTITPTTSTLNGAATLVLTTGQGAYIVSDGANWVAFASGTGASQWVTSGSNISFATGAVAIGTTAQGASNTSLTIKSQGSLRAFLMLSDSNGGPIAQWAATGSGGHTWQMSNNDTSAGNAGFMQWYDATANKTPFQFNSTNFDIYASGVLAFTSDASFINSGHEDTGISRAAAGILAVGTGGVGSTGGSLKAAGYMSVGTKFTASGCSNSTTVGGATAGGFTSGTTGTCTVVLTMNGATGVTAPNGWHCHATDETSGLTLGQTAHSATTATISGTTTNGDFVSFDCEGY